VAAQEKLIDGKKSHHHF